MCLSMNQEPELNWPRTERQQTKLKRTLQKTDRRPGAEEPGLGAGSVAKLGFLPAPVREALPIMYHLFS